MVKMLVYPSGRDIKHLLWLTSGNLHFISTWSLFFIASKIREHQWFLFWGKWGGIVSQPIEVLNIKQKNCIFLLYPHTSKWSQNTACHSGSDLLAGEFLLLCFEGFLRFVGEFQFLCFTERSQWVLLSNPSVLGGYFREVCWVILFPLTCPACWVRLWDAVRLG